MFLEVCAENVGVTEKMQTWIERTADAVTWLADETAVDLG